MTAIGTVLRLDRDACVVNEQMTNARNESITSLPPSIVYPSTG